jgi:RecA/RadA recombinase
MAKTKNIEQDIFKEFGIDPNKYLHDVITSDDYATFSISPRIDVTCGGGIKEGSLVLVSGLEKLGKTTFCLAAASSAQNQNDGVHRKVYYIDVENRIQPRDLKAFGLKTDEENLSVIGSVSGKLLSAEDVFKLCEKLVSNVRNCVIIIDSISMLCTKAEMDYDYENQFRQDVQKLTAIFCRKMSQVLRPSKNTIFGILHMHANQNANSPYAPKTIEQGGTKLKYAANYQFKLTHKEEVKNGEDHIGNKVNFKCLYHPGEGPATTSYYHHRFGHGIDLIKETIELAKDIGAIKSAGAWLKLPDGTQYQGLENLTEACRNSKEIFDLIKTSIENI